MLAWSAQDLLTIWEYGQCQNAVDRALTILERACPDKSFEELTSLSVGQRDARLLDLREKIFGPVLHGYAECPRCSERLEFSTRIKDIRAYRMESHAASAARTLEIKEEELSLSFRLPNSADLAAVGQCKDLHTAQRLIRQRCVISASRCGVPIDANDLPAIALSAIATRCSEDDPLAEVLIELSCPACDCRWTMLLDILSFLWAEISTQAKRLLREIHILASAYGWRESDILALSPARRNFYLELAG